MNALTSRLASAFVGNPHLLVISMVVILVGGISALRGLPRQEDPIISNRNVQIRTLYPGASASRVETLISEPLEQKLKEIPFVKHIESLSQAGISVVTVELQDAVDEESNDAIFAEIRDKMTEASAAFPPEAAPPVFDDKRIVVAFTSITALRWEDGREESLGILVRQAEELADRLRVLSGTDIVRIFGAPREEVRVEVDSRRLASLGLSVGTVAGVLRQADAKVPSGRLRGSGAELIVEVAGELDSVQRIREVPLVPLANGRQVRVGDVAEVRRAVMDPPEQLALKEGKRAILVAARLVPDQRIDTWAREVDGVLTAFRESVGGGIRLDSVFAQETYTSQRLQELAGNLLLGAAVVWAVILIMMGWRASLIVGAALPLTAALTLFVVALQGGKLHQMSIFGMIIALGLLIDNAIVVTDEVRRHLREGAAALEAVTRALGHLFLPLLASTLTTVLAFLPILLLPGNAGDFVSSIAGSVITALVASFLVAMTIIAALAGRFATRGGSRGGRSWIEEGVSAQRWMPWVRRRLEHALERPRQTVVLSLLLPLIGFGLAATLGSQFFPRTDRNMFEVEVRLGSEASIERTRAVAEAVGQAIAEEGGVTGVDWVIGASFPTVYYNLIMNRDGSSNYAHGIVTATNFEAVDEMVDRLQVRLDAAFPEAQILLTKFAQGPPADADIELRIFGPELETLQTLGEEVRRRLVEHRGVLHTVTTLPRGEPKLWVRAREGEAALAGLPLTEVAGQVQSLFEGRSGGAVIEDIETLPVRVREADAFRQQPENLRSLNLVLPQDKDREAAWMPVAAVAELDLRPEQGAITRRDGQRVNEILGDVKPDLLALDVTTQVMDRLEKEGFTLPPGYRLEVGGEAANRNEAVGNLFLYLPVILVLTVATLVLTFRSVRMAGILLLVAPLSAGYGLLATWAMGFPISFNTILGSIGLMGLTFNDNIVVLAALNKDPKAASGDPRAIVAAVLRSARHLVSTTLTTIGSFLPLLIFIGGQFWPPLAIVLAGGVGGATLLAMTFTPALFRWWVCKEKNESLPEGVPTWPQPA